VQDAVDRLEEFPDSGRQIPEFPGLPHREVVVPPCRVFYRVQGQVAWIVYVTRSERIIRKSQFAN
jgi:toxin ParE1/3/4